MHIPFRHTALLLHKATIWQMIGRCPVPISTTDAHFGAARLDAFFY